jgi:dihydroneopterin aldolase
MDEIALTGMTFFGRHGVNAEETALGQRFGLDLSIWLDLSAASESDRLADTVSYSAVYKLVREAMEGEPSQLLEHIAGRIARAVLAHDPRIERVRVKVSKLSPPLKGSTTGEVSVILTRSRPQMGNTLA